MTFSHITCAILLFLLPLPLIRAFIQPESDGRSYFAVSMANILELHSKVWDKKAPTSITISPAGVQKTLAILYNSGKDNDDLLDLMLMEMGLKYFDATRLMETAMEQMTSFDALKEDRFEKMDKPIKRADVLEYFKRDFNELGDEMLHNTILAIPSDLDVSNDFSKFAKEFFNATLLKQSDDKVKKNRVEMSKNKINTFNEIAFTTKWTPNFIESTDDHIVSTRGHFRYNEIENSENSHTTVRVLELPVDGKVPLSVLLVVPKHAEDLAWSTSYEVIRPLTDSNRVNNILKPHLVEVKLPKTFEFGCSIDLIEYLRKLCITSAKIYETPQKFDRMFKNPPKNGIALGKFWQNIKFKIDAKIVKKLPESHNGILHSIKEKFIDLTQMETFDVSEKPFLFLLKSNEVIYFMGIYYGKAKEEK